MEWRKDGIVGPPNAYTSTKQARIDLNKKQMDMCNKTTHNVYNSVKCDETAIYLYNQESKRYFAEWLFPDEDPPLRFKRLRNVCSLHWRNNSQSPPAGSQQFASLN